MAPTSWAISATAATSFTVPTAFEARPTATSFVRSLMVCSRSSATRVRVSGSTRTHRTFAPFSLAAVSQGSTLARWSSSVTTISVVSSHSLARAREIANVRVVMLAPKATSSGAAPRKSADASRAPARISSVSVLVGKTPCRFAPPRSIYPAMASMACRATWEPPGPSKYTTPRPLCVLPSAGNCSRTALTSNVRCISPPTFENLLPGAVYIRQGLEDGANVVYWEPRQGGRCAEASDQQPQLAAAHAQGRVLRGNGGSGRAHGIRVGAGLDGCRRKRGRGGRRRAPERDGPGARQDRP